MYHDDNAPIHTASLTEWFDEHESEVEHLPWPAQMCAQMPVNRSEYYRATLGRFGGASGDLATVAQNPSGYCAGLFFFKRFVFGLFAFNR